MTTDYLAQVCDSSGYELVSAADIGAGTPYSDPSSWGAYIVKPGVGHNNDFRNLLKPGETGLDGKIYHPTSVIDFPGIWYPNSQCRATFNRSEDIGYAVQMTFCDKLTSSDITPAEMSRRLGPYTVL
jgi:hypothetical protein